MTNGTATLEPRARHAQGLRPGVPIELHGLSWSDYLAVTDIIGDRRLRTFYFDGEMEILMPSHKHEVWVAILSQLVELLMLTLAIPKKSGGMTTFRREDIERGLEPDRCYYITNEPRVRDKLKIDLSVDPPPDLALEVEVTSSVEKRMCVYAELGVSEVWRFDGSALAVNNLIDGEYVRAQRSQFFPFLPPEELVRFAKLQGQMSETALLLSFRDWVTEQVAKGWPVNAQA